MQDNNTTQEKIIESATELFLEKGFHRTSVREIASRAKINISLMNYYFRSKEILFETIINLLIGKAATSLKEILDSDLDLEGKIKKYVDTYINLLISNPLLVSFILAILNHSPDKLTKLKVTDSLYNTEKFIEQLNQEYNKGNIRKVDPEQFYINMLSLIAFPFAIKNLIIEKSKFSKIEFVEFLESRKEIVIETLMSSLKP